MKNLTILILCLCYSFNSVAQEGTFVIHAEDKTHIQGLNEQLKQFTLVSSNTLDLYRFLELGGTNLSITDGITNIRINQLIEKTNISPNYLLKVLKGRDQEGNSIIEEYRGNVHGIRNYFGRTKDGGYFRMTMNKYGYLTMTCRMTNGNTWSIHPIRNFDIKAEGYVLFNQEHYLHSDKKHVCGTDVSKIKKEKNDPNVSIRGSRDWYEQELGIASDSAMWARHGSVAATNAHNSDITASCEPDWSHPDLHDSLTTVIIEEIVSQTHDDDPWEYHDVIVAGDAIAEFRTYSGFSTNPDTKKGASGNVWQGNVVGIAYVGNAGNPVTCGSYNVFMVKDLSLNSQNRNVESHERGHNMGCNHVTGNYIMRSSIGNPGFTNWKAISVDVIDQSIPAANCLDLIQLPITLLSFEGEIEQNKITLYWTVAEEINNEYFEVQKLNTNHVFESIATVYSRADNTDVTEYQYEDNSSLQNQNIYRLKQVDHTGEYTYSHTISLNYGSAVYNEMLISPNPTSDYISIYSSGRSANLWFSLYAINGQKILEGYQKIDDSAINKIDVQQLKNGAYYIDFYIDSQHFQKMFYKF